MSQLVSACAGAAVVADIDTAEVAVVVADGVDAETSRVIAALQRDGSPPVVLVATRLDDSGLMAAIESGVAGVVYRDEVDTEHLPRALRDVAAGRGSLPADLTARLMERMAEMQRRVLAPRGLTAPGLSEREIEVLRLLAEGYDTAEVAGRMCYSERTVKGVLHNITRRFNLKNRTQAVVFAMRKGLI
jgi:DNA-binding NarL/FixJ family response regulator